MNRLDIPKSGEDESPLLLTGPGTGFTTAAPWPQHLHDQWAATIEQADRYNWLIDARIEPGAVSLSESDLVPFLDGLLRALLRWQNEPRLTCAHVADCIAPTILVALETPVEVCFSEQCLSVLARVIDNEQFYGEHCSMCGSLDKPTRLRVAHVPILWGQLGMLCCEHHFARRA